jgi:ATP-dependent DNA helicase RecG
MLTVAEVNKLIASGSGQKVEILSPGLATVERMARSLVSFANGQGGALIVSLKHQSASRASSSSPSPDELLDRVAQALLLSDPHLIVPLPYPVQLAGDRHEGPMAIVVDIPEGLPHVYSLEGCYYIRDGAHDTTLPAKTLRTLLLTRSEGTWEATVPSGSSIDDLDWDRVEGYGAKLANVDVPTLEALLLRRGCVVRWDKVLKPTYAGLLLFGTEPQAWIRAAEILAVRYTGTAVTDVFTRQTISGCLPDQIRASELFVTDNLSRQAKVNGWKREEESPYPASMLRESIVNAVAHRDYRIGGSQILLLVFSDRIEIHSPGKLPGHITLANLVHERYSRNEAIMQVLCDMGFVERLGHGIDRILSAAKERKLPTPEFKETDAGFTVTLYAKPSTTDDLDKHPLPAQNQRVDKMMSFIRANGQITSREYQELCPGVSAESLRRDFVEMVEQGLIMRVGDKRGTYYISKK